MRPWVLVCSDCCDRIQWTGWFINNRKLFLTVLEAGKYKMKTPAESMPGECQLPGW